MDKHLVIKIGNHLLGIPGQSVQGIERQQHIYPLPSVTRAIKGLTHVRGNIYTVLDWAPILGVQIPVEVATYVVLCTFEHEIALIVDDILDFNESPKAAIPEEQYPSPLESDIICGAYRFADKVYHLLSIEKLSSILTRNNHATRSTKIQSTPSGDT